MSGTRLKFNQIKAILTAFWKISHSWNPAVAWKKKIPPMQVIPSAETPPRAKLDWTDIQESRKKKKTIPATTQAVAFAHLHSVAYRGHFLSILQPAYAWGWLPSNQAVEPHDAGQGVNTTDGAVLNHRLLCNTGLSLSSRPTQSLPTQSSSTNTTLTPLSSSPEQSSTSSTKFTWTEQLNQHTTDIQHSKNATLT